MIKTEKPLSSPRCPHSSSKDHFLYLVSHDAAMSPEKVKELEKKTGEADKEYNKKYN